MTDRSDSHDTLLGAIVGCIGTYVFTPIIGLVCLLCAGVVTGASIGSFGSMVSIERVDQPVIGNGSNEFTYDAEITKVTKPSQLITLASTVWPIVLIIAIITLLWRLSILKWILKIGVLVILIPSAIVALPIMLTVSYFADWNNTRENNNVESTVKESKKKDTQD